MRSWESTAWCWIWQFQLWLKSGIFKWISWLNGSFFRSDDPGFLKDALKTYLMAPMSSLDSPTFSSVLTSIDYACMNIRERSALSTSVLLGSTQGELGRFGLGKCKHCVGAWRTTSSSRPRVYASLVTNARKYFSRDTWDNTGGTIRYALAYDAGDIKYDREDFFFRMLTRLNNRTSHVSVASPNSE